MEPNAPKVPMCPLLSSNHIALCVEDQCAWYIIPVKKCALYVLGHQSAVELQQLQKK